MQARDTTLSAGRSWPPEYVTGTNTMPSAAPKPCTAPGCGKLVRDGSGRCEAHPKPAWAKPATATKRVTGRKLQRMRAQLFTTNPLCVMCESKGRVTRATQRDHIVPLSEGGADDSSNEQGLCEACHEIKSKAEAARGVRRWAKGRGA